MKKERDNKPGVIVIEGHVQGLANTRALGREGIPVIVVDKYNCIARYSKYCKGFFKCPDFRSDDFAEFLIKLANTKKLYGWTLIPSNDHAVYTIARFREKLSRHYKIITPELSVVDNIYKKHNLLALANRIDIPIPATWYPDSNDELIHTAFKFPVMVKGREGLTFYKTTGQKVFIANDLKELVLIFEGLTGKIKIEETFIQEIIPTDETNKTISFTAFCINGIIKAHWTGIKLREHPAKFGTSTFSQSIKNNVILEQSKKLLKVLNYPGVCEVEFLLDKRTNQYKLIEINARTWLWVGLAVANGINYPLMIYNFLNDIEMEYPKDYQEGIQWMNFVTDGVYSLKNILKGQLAFRSYLKTIRGKKVHAIYDSSDLVPSAMFLLLLPYLALKR